MRSVAVHEHIELPEAVDERSRQPAHLSVRRQIGLVHEMRGMADAAGNAL